MRGSLHEEAKILHDKVINFCDKAETQSGLTLVAEILGGLDIFFGMDEEEMYSFRSYRAVLMYAIASKIIPDYWKWEINESMNGIVRLILEEKK